MHSATRAADQTHVPNFWAPPIENYWNEIAHTVALGGTPRWLGIPDCSPRSTLSFADKTIAFHDATYASYFWLGNSAVPANPTYLDVAGGQYCA